VAAVKKNKAQSDTNEERLNMCILSLLRASWHSSQLISSGKGAGPGKSTTKKFPASWPVRFGRASVMR
jgi:hypothetical protein